MYCTLYNGDNMDFDGDEGVVDRWLSKRTERPGRGWGWRFQALYDVVADIAASAWSTASSPTLLYLVALFGTPLLVWTIGLYFVHAAGGYWAFWTYGLRGMVGVYFLMIVMGFFQIPAFRSSNQEGSAMLLAIFGGIGLIGYSVFAFGSVPDVNVRYASATLSERIERYGQAVQAIRNNDRELTRGNLIEHGPVDASTCDGVVRKDKVNFRCYKSTTGDTLSESDESDEIIEFQGYYHIEITKKNPPILTVYGLGPEDFQILYERLEQGGSYWTRAGHDESGMGKAYLRFEPPSRK